MSSGNSIWARVAHLSLAVVVALCATDMAQAQGRRGGKKKKGGSVEVSTRATILLERGRVLEDVDIREEKFEEIKYRAKGTRSTDGVRGERVVEIRYLEPDPIYASGLSRFRAGLYARAIESFDKVLGALEGDASWVWFYATYWRGEAKRLSGDSAGAVTDFQAVVEKDPGHFLAPRAFYGLGLAQAAQKASAEAEAAFKKLDQGFGQKWAARAQLGLGDAYLAMNQLLKARRSYGLAASRAAGDADLRLGAEVGEAKCQVARKEFEGALKAFDSIIRSTKASPEIMAAAWAGKGDCLQARAESGSDKNSLKEALIAYQTVVVRFAGVPESYPRALYRSAELYEKLGLGKLAELQRKELRSRCPSSPWTAKLK